MRVVATFTKARYTGVTVADPANTKHTGNARSTGTRKRQSHFGHVRVVVFNLKAHYIDVTIRTPANKPRGAKGKASMNKLCTCGAELWDGSLVCDACHERNKAIVTIYKAEDFTAVILVTDRGEVLDCQLTINPLSEYGRRMRERQRTPARYKNVMPYMGQALPVDEVYRDKPTKQAPLINDRAFIFDNVDI